MSINDVHRDINPEEAAHWWSQYMMDYSSYGRIISSPPHKKFSLSSSFSFNLNHSSSYNTNEEEDEEYSAAAEQANGRGREIPKEPLFEKPLTPSDVGKLNRLVIPKQHAERCFPLNTDSGENGLLLSFEDVDVMGKFWRFRYSYWNSSQSYVLTKGWSRFVKEKKLCAGDVVLFSRHRGRMFVGWRRGGAAHPSSGGAGSVVAPKQTSTVVTSGNSKRLRLFGVNLEYEPEDDSDRSEPSAGSPMSGQDHHHTPYHHQQQYHNYFFY